VSTATDTAFRHDVKVIGLVGFVHSLSHFYQLVLPPLFPLLKAEFDVSYAVLGSLFATFSITSGVAQFATGFLVDRRGARPVLYTGLGLLAGGVLLAAFVPGFAWLYAIVIAMGLGNGVFHPADFAILNANVAPRRLGPAYSTHGVGGNLGWALAPIVSFSLGELYGWRIAMAAMGAFGLIVLAVLATQRATLDCHHTGDGPRHTLAGSLPLFRQLPIVMCFAYFCIYAMGVIGLQTFAPSVLHAAFDTPLTLGASALSSFLLGGTAGIVAGGMLAARTPRHDLVAGAGMFAAAALLMLLAVWPPVRVALLPLFALAGFAIGCTGPSRDLIVRSATPPGAAGRVYGFVYSGLDLGGMIGPIWFGFMLDHAAAREVWFAIAGCFFVAIATVLQVRRGVSARRPALSD
jgi:MFS family permease